MPRSKKPQNEEDNAKELDKSGNSAAVKKERKRAPKPKKVIEKSKIWDTDDILWVIFSHSTHKDLVKFNTVCKRWNQASNPLIHKSIKLLRNIRIMNKSHDKSLGKKGKIDAEVGECIANNTKYAHLVKEFKYSEKIELHRTIQFFETFKYISQLVLSFIELSQDQFLSAINQLNMLKELDFEHVDVKYIASKKIYKNSIQLPSTLTKLCLKFVKLVNNPLLFFQTINSHTNLEEFNLEQFKFEAYNEHGFLEPFGNNYPSLKTFEYINKVKQFENSQQLLDMIQFNPQLTELTLGLEWMNTQLTNHICRYLTNLETLYLFDYRCLDPPYPPLYIKFPQPINIKKLKLIWDKLTPCSIESIILNCPNLEDLELSFYRSYRKADPLSFNIFKSTKINKLRIECDHLSGTTFDSMLLNCPHLRELEVQLPKSWKEWTNSIGSRCLNLEKLTLIPTNVIYNEERKIFLQELNEMTFLTNNPSYQSTLTSLKLHEIDLLKLKPEYLNRFSKLQSVKFSWHYSTYTIYIEQINQLEELFPSYEVLYYRGRICGFEVEFFKF